MCSNAWSVSVTNASNLKPAGLLRTPVMAQRFEVLAMDLFGPLPPTDQGERWVFAIEDTATRWIELFALKKATTDSCAKCLVDEVILRYGTPRRVISDNGPQFVSDILQKVSYCLGFEQNLTPVYYPSSNPEERRNRDLKTQLAIIVEKEHTKWSTALPAVRFAMDSALHLGVGQSPAYLCFGRELRTPLKVHDDLRAVVESENFVAEITPYLQTISETLKCARKTSERNQDRAKLYADPKRRPGPIYKKGDRVLVDVHALSKADSRYSSKFAPRRDGPYVIIEEVSPVTYVVASPNKLDEPLGKYHTSALRPFEKGARESVMPLVPLRRCGRPRKSTKEEPEEVPSPESPQNPIEPTPSQPGTHHRRRGRKPCSAPCCR
ncbi:hypothetical protein Zmor_003653 [Zophobas morio]|uniref:Integrase catalytic domain-containing protein n=1 Tax=Zophobas morio TaxID=2755281 RepID=A0AA38HSK2_9CUCU|nr:hypothetical protein Zmor_003653 [Zophobas morio]